jgi:hypothetical protein
MAMINNIQIKQVAKDVEDRGYNYDYVGIRIEEEVNSVIGTILDHQSSVWEDGNELDEKLNGVCAIDIDRVKELSNVAYNGYLGNIVLILGSEHAEYGEDAGEIIMENPVVLDIIVLED